MENGFGSQTGDSLDDEAYLDSGVLKEGTWDG